MVCGVRLRKACRALYQEAYRAEHRPSLMRAIVAKGAGGRLKLGCGHVVDVEVPPYRGQKKTRCQVCAELLGEP